MFDPFRDYETAGYLRNFQSEKDLEIVKVAEHDLFKAQLPSAMHYLAGCKRIEYENFLKIHEVLFSGLYPWAGQDRAAVMPDRHVSKGEVEFCHPLDCRRAVENGLQDAQARGLIAARPGHIMGLFAYGHPFLDGNGRTMLVVHSELCFRAGMSIDWSRTNKNAYLAALTQEIEHPNQGHLDTYLAGFVGPKIAREAWAGGLTALPGLDGINVQANDAADYSEPAVAQRYRDFEAKRAT